MGDDLQQQQEQYNAYRNDEQYADGGSGAGVGSGLSSGYGAGAGYGQDENGYLQYQANQQENVENQGLEQQQGVFRNNNETAKTQNTDMRRKYPHDKLNKKSEWIGVQQHLAEVNNEIRKNEIEINRLRQKELISEHEKMVIKQLQVKQQDLANKRIDHEEVLLKQMAFSEEFSKNKGEVKLLQQSIADHHSRQREEQQRKESEFRSQKNEWESKLLEYNSQRMQEEQKRNREHKDFLKVAANDDLNRAIARKEADRQSQLQNRVEYNGLVQMNAERELTKEENYRNFYRMASENQQRLHENHFSSVYMPLSKKQKELEDMIQKNVTEGERRRLQNEIDRIQSLKSMLMDTRDKNQNMMGEKTYQSELDRNFKGQQVKERLEDLQSYNQYQQFKKKEDNEGKKKYKDYLDQQAKERHDIQLNEERMTRNEKGLNRLDLQAFKAHDSGLYTMLPGWSPQVGQLPPRQSQIKLNSVDEQNKLAGGSSPTIAGTLASAARNSLVLQSHPNLGQFQKIGELESRYGNSVNYGQTYYDNQTNTKKLNGSMVYGHNPIFNPIPINNQNPYISRDLKKVLQNRQGSEFNPISQSARY